MVPESSKDKGLRGRFLTDLPHLLGDAMEVSRPSTRTRRSAHVSLSSIAWRTAAIAEDVCSKRRYCSRLSTGQRSLVANVPVQL